MHDGDGNDSKARGGHARAKALDAETRTRIARKAAAARWSADVPRASHEGSFRIGSTEISAAVLPNGLRLLSQGTFLRAIGRSRSPTGGTGALSTMDATPFFLQAEVLKPFVSEDLLQATTPIFFVDKSGRRAVGYDARLLPQVAEVYLKFRDACTTTGKSVPRQFGHIVRACDVLTRALATVGIVALVDEATGYQDVRDRQALQAILDAYLAKEFAAWAKCFPDEFYRQIFRLRNWNWKGMKVNRPQVVASYTNDFVYARLAPGILDELRERNPLNEQGRRRIRHHQWLSDDIGHPALAQHLHSVIGLMKAADSWDQFKQMIDRVYPRRTDIKDLPLFSGVV